jgi:uncharacterized membrane protein YqjE
LTGEIGSSSNPISGMTVATLLLTSLIFLIIGWVGSDYRVTALSVAAIVCVAASGPSPEVREKLRITSGITLFRPIWAPLGAG